jgi:hypothetical protein
MKKLLLAALIALSVSSCKKDNSSPDPTLPAKGGKLVAKTVVTSSTSTSTTTYNYNDKNQLTDAHLIFSSNIGKVDYIYTYNTDGTLKRESASQPTSTYYRDFTYVNGEPTLILHAESLGNANNSYTVKVKTNGTYTTEGTFYNLEGTTPGSTSKFEYQNQNRVKTTSTYNGEILSTYVAEFGNKKNPFLYNTDNWGLTTSIAFNNKNDLLKEIETTAGKITTSVYANTYDDDGYPVKSIKTSTQVIEGISTPYVTEITTVYTYIKLK